KIGAQTQKVGEQTIPETRKALAGGKELPGEKSKGNSQEKPQASSVSSQTKNGKTSATAEMKTPQANESPSNLPGATAQTDASKKAGSQTQNSEKTAPGPGKTLAGSKGSPEEKSQGNSQGKPEVSSVSSQSKNSKTSVNVEMKNPGEGNSQG